MNVFTQNLTICYSPGGLSTVFGKQATLKGGSIFIFCPVLSCSVSTPFGGPLASPTNSRYNRAWKIYHRADKGNEGAAKFHGKSLTKVFFEKREKSTIGEEGTTNLVVLKTTFYFLFPWCSFLVSGTPWRKDACLAREDEQWHYHTHTHTVGLLPGTWWVFAPFVSPGAQQSRIEHGTTCRVHGWSASCWMWWLAKAYFFRFELKSVMKFFASSSNNLGYIVILLLCVYLVYRVWKLQIRFEYIFWNSFGWFLSS